MKHLSWFPVVAMLLSGQVLAHPGHAAGQHSHGPDYVVWSLGILVLGLGWLLIRRTKNRLTRAS